MSRIKQTKMVLPTCKTDGNEFKQGTPRPFEAVHTFKQDVFAGKKVPGPIKSR